MAELKIGDSVDYVNSIDVMVAEGHSQAKNIHEHVLVLTINDQSFVFGADELKMMEHFPTQFDKAMQYVLNKNKELIS